MSAILILRGGVGSDWDIWGQSSRSQGSGICQQMHSRRQAIAPCNRAICVAPGDWGTGRRQVVATVIGPKINYRARLLMKSIPVKPFMAADISASGPDMIRLERLGLVRRKDRVMVGKNPTVKWELTGEGKDWRDKYICQIR